MPGGRSRRNQRRTLDRSSQAAKGPLRRIVAWPQVQIGNTSATRQVERLECGHTKTIREFAYGRTIATRRRCGACQTEMDGAARAMRLTMRGNPDPLRRITGPPILSRKQNTYGRVFDPLECGHGYARQRPRTGLDSQEGERRRCRQCGITRAERAVNLAAKEAEMARRGLVKGDS